MHHILRVVRTSATPWILSSGRIGGTVISLSIQSQRLVEDVLLRGGR